MVHQCCRKDMKRFNHLVDEVIKKTDQTLRQCLGQTRQMIGDIINMEMAYVNVHHPDFIGTQGAIRRLMAQKGMSYQDTKATLAAEDARRQEAAKTGQSFEGASPGTQTQHTSLVVLYELVS